MKDVSVDLRRWLFPFRLSDPNIRVISGVDLEMFYTPAMTCVTLLSTIFTLSSTVTTLSLTLAIPLSMAPTVSATPLTLSSTVCVIFRFWALAIRASSCVSLSSLFSASSILVLPINFFAYFSEQPFVKQFSYCTANTHLIGLAWSLLSQSRG